MVFSTEPVRLIVKTGAVLADVGAGVDEGGAAVAAAPPQPATMKAAARIAGTVTNDLAAFAFTECSSRFVPAKPAAIAP
jgi:hypothetical protein